MSKPALEFFPVSNAAWRPVKGSRLTRVDERVLAADGSLATRILRFAPGTDTTSTGQQAHDFAEEVYILSGSLTDLRLGRIFAMGMYACRPPGMRHGPWTSAEGCVIFEVGYRTRTSRDWFRSCADTTAGSTDHAAKAGATSPTCPTRARIS
jgi:ChrR Cupin-like domain